MCFNGIITGRLLMIRTSKGLTVWMTVKPSRSRASRCVKTMVASQFVALAAQKGRQSSGFGHVGRQLYARLHSQPLPCEPELSEAHNKGETNNK